jgi:Ca-activated chloride channel homolog
VNVSRLANPTALNLLWLIPVILFLAWYFARRQKGRIKNALGKELTPMLTSSVSIAKRRLKLILEVVVLALMIMALARPQSGESRQKVKSEGVEIILLVDVSQSMLAEDVRPSRLEFAKKELTKLLGVGGGHRYGLVAFAGSAVTLSPLTNDHSAIEMYLESLSPLTVSTQGTDFKRALEEAKGAFERGGIEGSPDTAVSRVVLVASDGEDNEAGSLAAARELAESGARIYTMAFGTERGGSIPVRDGRGNLVGTLKDKDGTEVVSKVGGKALEELAREGKGKFYHATFGGDTMKTFAHDLDQLQKAQFADAEITNYDEDYQGILLLAVLLGLIELVLGERFFGRRIWRGRFEGA